MECLLYCEVNVLCMAMLLIILGKVMRTGLGSTHRRRAFTASVLSAVFVNFFDILWELGLTGTWPVHTYILHLFNAAYFLALGCCSFAWLLFSDAVWWRRLYKHTAFHILAQLPLLILLVLSILSVFNGCFMYIDADGNYCRGPLFMWQYILSFGYVFAAAIYHVFGLLMRRGHVRRGDSTLIFTFVIPPLVCSVLQLLFQPLPILSASPAIAFLLVYTGSLQSRLSMDALTGIGNRRELLLALSDRMRSLPEDRDLYLLFMDVDNFKEINDTYGHYTGDRVLQRVANALQSVCAETKGVCGRYGGDEFVIIQELPSGGGVEPLIAHLRDCIWERCVSGVPDASHVRVSIGYAVYDRETDDVPTLIMRADRAMYAEKARAHRA